MSYLVRAAPPEHYEWFLDRTKLAVTDGFRGIEALDKDGRIRGFVGFDFWTPNSVHAHMAGDSPIAVRRLAVPAFKYVFEQSGRGLMVGIIRSGNVRSLALTRALGFREVYRQSNGWAPGDDLIQFEMRKDECRWLPKTERRAA